VFQVVDVAEELVLQLGVVDHRDGAVLVQGARVRHQARCEVHQVRRYLLYHHPPGSHTCRNVIKAQVH